jgi:bifunctional DNA-binding transcriptional regulator/antitoxin component of YhaV-PrlF toxin-antitoxin module
MLRDRLKIDAAFIDELNQYFADPGNNFINEILSVVEKYGTPEQINEKARQAKKLSNLFERLKNQESPYVKDLEWLKTVRDKGAFIPISQYRRNILGDKADSMSFNEGKAVTLEISALQYFPWLIEEAKQAIDKKEIMPGRFIRVRKMKEQESDNGDILAIAAAMQIVGASYVETLDTKGTDGSNVHLGGPATITGYFGGIGQPNEHPLMWIDEVLYYYTNYGIDEVLNINPGTVFLGYMLYKLGINIKFKISVFMGNDNPFSVLWTLLMARLFSREDGTTSLIGFNLSNAVNNDTIAQSSEIRKRFGLENNVRIEHHITETYKSIVLQPYNRRDELMELARTIPNISAKHEGGDPDAEVKLAHQSDILDYFRSKEEVIASGDMNNLMINYLGKHDAVNNTAKALTENGLSFIGATKLHKR